MYLSGKVHPDLPAMLQPGMGNLPPAGQPWAADNGRYSRPETYTDEAYLAWLRRHEPARARCLFATAPDVVADAAATLALSAPMLPRIAAAGYRPALVAQDGLEHLAVPWGSFGALFLGGTTAWKLGEAAHELATEAKARGKWLHMGRVNSGRRLRLAAAMGCDSADGTYLRFAMRTRVNGPTSDGPADVAEWLDSIERHPRLGL